MSNHRMSFKVNLKWFTIPLAIVAVTVLLLGTAIAKKPPPPPPHECDGSHIEVVVESLCGLSKTIQVYDSTAVCNIECHWYKPSKGKGNKVECPLLFISWIGGTVVADESAEHGFYFEPNSVIVAEITAEGMQTTPCQIAANPGFYDGGLWYIGGNITSLTDL
jgi:hypothetical protein